VPVGLVTLLLAARFVPESRAGGQRRGFDLAGAVSVTAGLMVLVYGIVKAQDWGWGSARTLGVMAGAVVLLAAFVVIELRSANPLVRLGLFRSRSLSSANAVMLVVAGGLFAMFFLASLYVQQVLDFSPVEAGLGFVPLTAGIVAASAAAQRLIAQLGVRVVVIIGLSLATVGLLLLAFVSPDGSYVTDVLPGILVMSIGLGLTFVPLTLIATTNVAPDDAGLASGVFNTSQQVGGALGLAILSTLAASRTESVLGDLGHPATAADQTSALVDGFQVAFAAGAGLTAVGLLMVLLLVRRRDVAAINATEPVVTHA
jgi:predicted MFS family arabinose efflux permease